MGEVDGEWLADDGKSRRAAPGCSPRQQCAVVLVSTRGRRLADGLGQVVAVDEAGFVRGGEEAEGWS